MSARKTGPVTCSRCGQSWPRDPALEVACPECYAPVGSPCKRPSGHKAAQLHASRDRLAMSLGLLVKCPGIKGTERSGDRATEGR